MAEQVARRLIDEAGLAGAVSVESFGTAGYHVGEPADPAADAALARHGWPSGGHRARRIRPADLGRLDLVLCADGNNLDDVTTMAGGKDPDRFRLLRSFDPAAGPDAAVPDPWGQDAAGFDRCLDLIERACHGLVDGLAARAG
jgi:low molecular weight protein-tyrosine phosphatase